MRRRAARAFPGLSLAGLGLAGLALGAQAPLRVQEGALRAHLAFLSDDLLEGRGMGLRGGELATAYLEAQLRAMGLKPAHGESFRQPIPFTGARALSDQSSLRFAGKGASVSFSCGPEILYNTSSGLAEVGFDAPLVFAGYGVCAPEERWDDFKGVDLRGKLVVVMAGEPAPTAQEPRLFDGKSLTYYGRYTYKFEEAKRRGAVGALIIHSAAYPSSWNGLVATGSGERFHLANPKDGGVPFMGWIQEDSARQLFQTVGLDLDRLQAAAKSRDFRPLELGLSLEGTLVNRTRSLTPANVAGLVPGTDPRLKDEVVIYSAHWDHLGPALDGKGGAFNGAVDNASGCAALLALAAEAVKRPAPRTQMFLFTCGEEAGLLGAAGYVQDPLWPLNRTKAVLNMDCLNFAGRTRDIGLQGAERSFLGPLGRRVARRMGLRVRQEPPDAQGLYFRADHFAFAQAGIPAFTLTMVMGADAGWDFEDPARRTLAESYVKGRYHTSGDRYDPAWDLRGMVDQAQFLLNLGQEVAGNAGKGRAQ